MTSYLPGESAAETLTIPVKQGVYQTILSKKKAGKKQFAVLVDPDKAGASHLEQIAAECESSETDFLFVGGTLLTNNNMSECIRILKNSCAIPVVIFPGNTMQIDEQADAILFLSLISGRNPDLLIGKQVISAPIIREKNIEAISTGYMLIESGTPTAALYMSGTAPIPHDKYDIASCTAMAGEMLGMRMIFMDGGSGAQNPVSEKMIEEVRKNISVPLIVGGGIRTPEKAMRNCKAGADLIVVGNSIEKDFSLVKEIAAAVQTA
jgi:putative glycerol-1-phosphate prenyltransferase